MINDYLHFAVSNILHRKLRSWLTVLGIIIGVAAIIALISVSQGLKGSIEEQFSTFGADRILISAQGFQGPGSASKGLTEKDVDTIKKLSEFKYVSPSVFTTAEVEYSNEVKFTSVQGLPAEDYTEAFKDVGLEIEEGRMIRPGEKKVALIGHRVSNVMFDKKIRLRSKIDINGEEFTVIGILKEIGNAQDDNSINIPIDAYRDAFNEPDHVDIIIAQAKEGIDISELQEKVERELKKARDDENYQVLTAEQIAQQINNILGVVQVVLIRVSWKERKK